MLAEELSNEVRSEGGLGDVVVFSSAGGDVGGVVCSSDSVEALSTALASASGAVGALSPGACSIVFE